MEKKSRKELSDIREKIVRKMNDPENQLRSMSESTGLRIVDALYTLIDLFIMEKNQYGENHKRRRGIMERNKTIVTLVPVKGRENELKKILDRYSKTLEMQGAGIVKGETRTIHYHVIGEDLDQIVKGMKEWPGIRIKVHKISESQAQEMKLRHVPYCYFLDEGMQHEGDSVSE